jgi:hypothetical protein
MARNSGVQIAGGSGLMGKLKALIVLALVVGFVVTNPHGAAIAAKGGWHLFLVVVDGLGAFLGALSGGDR